MWPVHFIILLISSVLADLTAPWIERSVSDGVTSMGYNVVYGDEDLAVINEVVGEEEKWNTIMKSSDVYRALPPLPAQDVKCLMSVDRYCSKDMGKMKNVLIQALKDDCSKCSTEERESAGRVVASMMAHDPTAWKLFLTRYCGQRKLPSIWSTLQAFPKKKLPKQEMPKFKITGEPEFIENTRNRYTMPGFKVRVKRYSAERLN